MTALVVPDLAAFEDVEPPPPTRFYTERPHPFTLHESRGLVWPIC